MSTQRNSEKSEGKRKRIPFGGNRTKLQLSDQEREAIDKAGYVPRWFNDADGRIGRAEAGGWEFVSPDEALSVSESSLHEGNTDLNSKVSKVVSRGTDKQVRAVLMKIKKEWYNEDQERKEDRNRAVDEALRIGQPGGNVVENQYVPKGHTQSI